MAYLTFANFRTATIAWYTKGLDLNSTTDYPDAMLTAAIAAQSKRFDLLTNDHFAPPATDTAITVLVDSIGGVAVNLVTSPLVFSPKRIRTLTKVETQDATGTFTEEVATTWRLTQSVHGVTADDVDVRGYDFLTVIPGQSLSWGYPLWPFGPQTVRLTGKFDWPATPDLVKRGVAIMVWDSLKPIADVLRRSDRMVNSEAAYYYGDRPPELTDILKLYKRPKLPLP